MSQLVLNNGTSYPAQYTVTKGQQVIARLPGIEPGASVSVPTAATYLVSATTVIEGNTYTSAPLTVTGGRTLRAQVMQEARQGTYVFDVVELQGSDPHQLVFEATTLNPVTFTILRDGRPLQSIVVQGSGSVTLDIGGSFTIQAVINGITTAVLETSRPDAVITAINDTTEIETGYFTLVLGLTPNAAVSIVLQA